MITCPLCEHQQEFGFECEQCGKDLGTLADLGLPPTRDEPLEGLETHEAVGDVAPETLPEIERTTYAPAEVSPDVTPEIELTAHGSVGEVPVEPLIDLTVDRVVDDEPRTPQVKGSVSCRYCHHVQPEQLLCERCGMSLPRLAGTAAARVPVSVIRPHDEMTRCRACGAPAKVGQRCGDCGHENDPPS